MATAQIGMHDYIEFTDAGTHRGYVTHVNVSDDMVDPITHLRVSVDGGGLRVIHLEQVTSVIRAVPRETVKKSGETV